MQVISFSFEAGFRAKSQSRRSGGSYPRRPFFIFDMLVTFARGAFISAFAAAKRRRAPSGRG
jgi:hypothetical protein